MLAVDSSGSEFVSDGVSGSSCRQSFAGVLFAAFVSAVASEVVRAHGEEDCKKSDSSVPFFDVGIGLSEQFDFFEPVFGRTNFV